MGNTRSGKQKGRLGQQEIRDMILETFTDLEEGDVKSTTMGEGGVDVQLSPKALTQVPLSIEVKRRRAFQTLYKWYEQADRKDGNEPVVFFRADRQKWLTVVDSKHYIGLLKDAKKNT